MLSYKIFMSSKKGFTVLKTDCGVKVSPCCGGIPIFYDEVVGYNSTSVSLSVQGNITSYNESEIKNALSPTWIEFWKDCQSELKGEQITIDPDTELEVSQKSPFKTTYCTPEGALCEISGWCDQDEVLTYLVGGQVISQSEFDSLGYTIPVKKGYEVQTIEKWYSIDDKKQSNPICVKLVKDLKTQDLNYFLEIDVANEDFTNPLNKKDYMSNIVGNAITPDLASKTSSDCIVVCIDAGASKTVADVVAEGVAAGILLPDGNPPTGYVNYSISQLNPGQIAQDDAGDDKKIKFGGNLKFKGESINYGTTVCPPKEDLVDNDCDGKFPSTDPTLVFENTGTEPVAFRLCALWTPADADDEDENV